MRVPLVILATLIFFSASVTAQQDQSLVLSHSAEIIFPQAIRFSLNLTVFAAQVDKLQLVIHPDSPNEISFDVNPATAAIIFEEGESRMRFDWLFTTDQAPVWDDVIDYRWSLMLNDGRSAAVEDQFVFTDPREDWMNYTDARGHYGLSVPRRLNRDVIDFASIYDRISENSGATHHLAWIIYPSELEPGCQRATDNNGDVHFTAVGVSTGYTLDCDPASFDWTTSGWQVLQLKAGERLEDLIVNKLVELYYVPSWENKAVPDWFRYGLAQLYAPSAKSLLLSTTRQTIRTGQPLSPRAMATRQDSLEWQAQSYGMVAYLVDQLGVIGVFRLANRIASAPDFETAYQETVGQNLDTLIPTYQRWIFSRNAETAFGVTPYQPPTGTPTPTDTPTWTPTFTPSVTPTITPTPTVTGEITRTKAPTVTPVPLTPRPPTNTPRSPGSLQTPTPVPVSVAPSVLEQPTIRISVIAVLVVVLILLIALLIRSGGRR